MNSGDAWNISESVENNETNGYSCRQVICSWCEHKYVSVHPYGISELECPKCSLMTRVGARRLRHCAAGFRLKQRQKEKHYRFKNPRFVLLPASATEREDD